MTATPDTDRRLEALETKASYADDLLDQLNETIWRQQQQIDRLRRELAALQQQWQGLADGGAGAPRSLLDERPPHY